MVRSSTFVRNPALLIIYIIVSGLETPAWRWVTTLHGLHFIRKRLYLSRRYIVVIAMCRGGYRSLVEKYHIEGSSPPKLLSKNKVDVPFDLLELMGVQKIGTEDRPRRVRANSWAITSMLSVILCADRCREAPFYQLKHSIS